MRSGVGIVMGGICESKGEQVTVVWHLNLDSFTMAVLACPRSCAANGRISWVRRAVATSVAPPPPENQPSCQRFVSSLAQRRNVILSSSLHGSDIGVLSTPRWTNEQARLRAGKCRRHGIRGVGIGCVGQGCSDPEGSDAQDE